MSIWQEDIQKNTYDELNNDIDVDILIIGGGITGISTAYHLLKSNLKVIVVEKNSIASGVTAKTTGKLTYLQDLMFSKISDKYSFDVAKQYYESQKDAIKLVRNIVEENKIYCDYVVQKSYLFASEKSEVIKVKKEQELLEKFGEKVGIVKKLPINIHNFYGISVSDTAYFHPVKYVNELAKICQKNGIQIYENTNVFDFKLDNNKYICYTNNNKIIAKKIVFACHYPFFTVPFLFPIKGYLERSYISASPVDKNKPVSGINTSKNTTSFRYHSSLGKNYLIYLKGSHNLAFKYNVCDNFKELNKDLEKLDLIPNYLWSNEDIITNDYLPYIGLISDNLYIGVGYNTWGMTNGSLAGLILSDMILGKNNKYISLFNPMRDMAIDNVFSIIYDTYSSVKSIIDSKIYKNKKFYSDRVVFTKKNGKDVAIYIDKDGIKHMVYNKCPHLKCNLIFNEEELTWDCPCHSSRFDLDGYVIKGPSNYNISYKKSNKKKKMD